MSMYPNSAYMQAPLPPPAANSNSQNNLVNGIPPQAMPMPSNVQSTPQQQQQFILQQKQQFQQHQSPLQTLPPTMSNPNMSKFLPPTATTSFASSQQSPLPPTNVNSPMRPPTTQAASNLPPHLRPPGLNGMHNNGAPLTNGGGASEASANSSRTASPALQTTMPPPPTMLTSRSGLVPPTTFTAAKPAPAGPAATTTTTTPSNIGAMTGSMQNLNLNHQNGPIGVPQQQQPQQQLSQMPLMPPKTGLAGPPSNFQNNFKTSALNTTQPPPTSAASMPPVSTAIQQQQQQQHPQFRTLPPTNATLQQQQQQFQPTTTSSQTLTATRPMPPPTQSTAPQNANYAPGMGNFPPNVAALQQQQQNQLNNNQPQQPLQSTQRRPMYPMSGPLPPMPPTSNATQLQQPYAQAYHQHSQSQPGMFNGQMNSGPLQYQNQAQLPPQQQQLQQQQQQQYALTNPQYNPQGGSVQQGFNRLWGQDTIDLMQNRHILSPNTLMPPKVVLHNQFQESINCSPNIMRCTIAKIPESNALLQKSRLPLGIVIHPFRDINSLPVIQCPNIVRCRLCRTYINPFVYFVDSKMWKCNLCYRTNELPDDFQFDPATKTYGDVTRRPEVRSSTIEFIAPSEYMLRPPQPAIYLFLFDVSIIAQQCGYLENACAVLSKHLDDMPGDARAQVGFIAYNSQVHFYSMAEGYNQPHEMTLLDIDEPFLPRPDNLLVNLKECKELVKDLLTQLPKRFADTHDPGSALGAALQVAYKLMQASGGRVTVFQTCLPNKGPGALEARENPNNRSAKDVAHLNPATDFYKRYALDSSGYQIAVDLFLMNQQYSDLATISGISKHSGGCVHHFPLYQKTKPQLVDSFKQCFKRYLIRKIGFEAVMRIRCTRGLQVHTFHGNFFVRSTDLLSLPNVNPDAGYGMQISYEETLSDVKTICFQAALLYTNSEGERRIRVHTLCLPVTASLPEVMHAADAEAIIGLLSKMAVDRSLTSNVADAREAFLNATVDIFTAFKVAQNLPSGQSGQLIAPRSLALLPLYILALLKHRAFRVGTSTRLDDRVFAMDSMKTLPLDQLIKFIYPEFYQIDVLFYNTRNPNAHTNSTEDEEEDDYLPEVTRLQLSAEFLDSRSIFLLDCGTLIIIYVGLNVPADVLEKVFGIKSTAELPDYCYGLPNVNSPENDALRRFIMRLNEDKPFAPTVQIIRDTSTAKPEFIEKLIDDRSESSLSYYEFLQHIRAQVK